MLCNKEFKGINGTKVSRRYGISVMGDGIKSYIVTDPTEMRHQLIYFLTKNHMIKVILQKRIIINSYCYQEYVEISANNIFMRSSGSRGDVVSIGSNYSGEWSWYPLIPMYYYYLFPIITTFLE